MPQGYENGLLVHVNLCKVPKVSSKPRKKRIVSSWSMRIIGPCVEFI